MRPIRPRRKDTLHLTSRNDGNFSWLQDIYYEDTAGTVYSFEERNACMTLTRDNFPPLLICLPSMRESLRSVTFKKKSSPAPNSALMEAQVLIDCRKKKKKKVKQTFFKTFFSTIRRILNGINVRNSRNSNLRFLFIR